MVRDSHPRRSGHINTIVIINKPLAIGAVAAIAVERSAAW